MAFLRSSSPDCDSFWQVVSSCLHFIGPLVSKLVGERLHQDALLFFAFIWTFKYPKSVAVEREGLWGAAHSEIVPKDDLFERVLRTFSHEQLLGLIFGHVLEARYRAKECVILPTSSGPTILDERAGL